MITNMTWPAAIGNEVDAAELYGMRLRRRTSAGKGGLLLLMLRIKLKQDDLAQGLRFVLWSGQIPLLLYWTGSTG